MTGDIVLKYALTNFFKWIVANDLFSVVKIVNLVHDEICIEYPESMSEIADKLKFYMEESAKMFCSKLPIPAEAEISTHWVH